MGLKQFLKNTLPEPAVEILRSIKKNIPHTKATDILAVYGNNIFNRTKHKFSLEKDAFLLSYDLLGEDIEVFFPYSKFNQPIHMVEEIPSYFQVQGMIRKGDIVIDAGAWPGDFTTIASKLVGDSGKVIALEPNPANYQYLESVLYANKTTRNVDALKLGLYSSETKVSFAENGVGSKIEPETGTTSINTVTLDTIIGKLNPDRRVIIKMDIEGAEVEAVKGASRSMGNENMYFMIASYHIVEGKKTKDILEPMFRDKGLQVKHHYPRHLTTYASAK